jgi:CRP-like cAMP-binding protein
MPVPERAFRALRAVPAFGPLALATVENVSRRVTELHVGAGDVVIREGDSGDRLYVIAEGAAAIDRGGAHVGERGPGDFFGEIALLRDIPRTATVTALSDSVLFALDRDAFQLAISSHPRSADAVRVAADARFELAPQP